MEKLKELNPLGADAYNKRIEVYKKHTGGETNQGSRDEKEQGHL
jgi:hypothetical protein